MNKESIFKWSKLIHDLLSVGTDIYIVGDTETTGKNELGNKKNFGRKDRVLEIGFLFCTVRENGTLSAIIDDNGEHVRFHEYINPFAEPKSDLERYNSIMDIPQEVIDIHGIDQGFLNGESGLLNSHGQRSGYKLKVAAPTFSKVKPYLEMLLNTDNLIGLNGRVHFIAHNALFDAQFMSAEWIKSEVFDERNSVPASFESYVNVIDSLELMKSLYSRSELVAEASSRGITSKIGYSLDSLREFYNIATPRDMHGALIDSQILMSVYNSIIVDKRYQESTMVSMKAKTGFVPSSQGVFNLFSI